MKLAALSESPADEAATFILAGALYEQSLEPVERQQFRLRENGWPSVIRIAPTVIRHLHYRTDVDALAIVVDTNDSPKHEPMEAQQPQGCGCRLCAIREVVQSTLESLRERPVGGSLLMTVGIAVPAIEAWYLCGKKPHVSEAAWHTRTAPYTKASLKVDAYGSSTPSAAMELEVAVREARRVSADLSSLLQQFPTGFGAFAESVRSWR
jgi:hypothetical protein